MNGIRPLLIVAAFIACSPWPHAQRTIALLDFELSELWEDPVDLPQRNLFYGSGGQGLAPPLTGGTYQFLSYKTTGTNPGYELRDAAGRLWSVKMGIEAQPEIAASRILWAIGFHQPPMYFVHAFTATGTDAAPTTQARFRTEFAQWKSANDWDWYDNPFTNSKPFRGLIVAQLILNQSDLKAPNNRIYEAIDPSTTPRRLYVVRDLGAAFGRARQAAFFKLLGTAGAQGSKNDIDDFEAQGFITGVDRDHVSFDYRGMNQALVDIPTAEDVRWTCELMNRLSDQQWADAFRAAAYPEGIALRYIRKLKSKIAEGPAIRPPMR